MKKILVPTDFSEVADNAFVHALELASKVDAELLLLHTYELPIVDNQFAPGNYQTIFDSLELSKFEKKNSKNDGSSDEVVSKGKII